MRTACCLPLLLLLGCVADDADETALGTSLVINEFLASNDSQGSDEQGEFDDWAELYNAGDEPFELHGLYFSDNLGDPRKHQIIDPGAVLMPGEYVLIWCDSQPEQGPYHTSFNLSASGEDIVITSAGGQALDAITFGAQTTDVSLGRSPDGSGNWIEFALPTPGASNEEAEPVFEARLVLNEILADNGGCCPDEHGDFDDYIELRNIGNAPALLNGLALSDDAALPELFLLSLPADSSLPPGERCVFWCDDQGEQGPFHTPFGLSRNGESLWLRHGSQADSVVFPALAADEAWGRHPATHSWMAMQSPTPGQENLPAAGSTPGGLLINEYLASNDFCCSDENGEFDDWIEVYNSGNAPVPLNGLFLSDDGAEPLKHQVEIPGDSLLPPGGHAVFWCDSQVSQGPFHCGFALSAGGEQIRLSAADGTLLDSRDYDTQTTDVSEGRSPDGSDSWTNFVTPTPGAANE